MNRRRFFSFFPCPLLASAAPALHPEPLDTPQRRADYLQRMLRVLCKEPRPSGSKSYDAGIALVERELQRALPIVSRDTLEFRRWLPVGQPLFRIAGQPLETYLADNSPPTSATGTIGVLRKRGPYEVVDRTSEKLLARAAISEFGRAIVSNHSGNDDVPLFNIGRQDVETLDRAVRDNLPVEVRAQVKWIPRVKTSNVVGILPGDSQDEIMIVAHADTKYSTPGAHDNTASLITMLMLAHAMSGTRPKRTISFLATTGEELNFFGAKHYAETRRQNGTLNNIKVCINLDSLTYGPNLQINTTDSPLAQRILDIHRDLAINASPKVFSRDDTMDSAPFLAVGARTVHLNSRGDDARTLPLWHRPEDRAETVNPAFVETSFRVLLALVARLP